MSVKQVAGSVARDSCLLPIDACGSIPDDVVLLVYHALRSLSGRARDALRAWIEVEASKSSWLRNYLPLSSILRFLDLLEIVWGLDRLIAYDLYGEINSPSDLRIYESYLEKFYDSNCHYQSKKADVIFQCLQKEKDLSSEWKAKRFSVIPFDTELSIKIQEYMSDIVNDENELTRPVVTCAAACITKEAELMIEWLKQESNVSQEEVCISSEIREMAMDLVMFKGDRSVHAAAVLLGITKEARALLESANCMESTDISMSIRAYGLEFLTRQVCKFSRNAKLTPELSDTVEVNQLTGTFPAQMKLSSKDEEGKLVESSIDEKDVIIKNLKEELARCQSELGSKEKKFKDVEASLQSVIEKLNKKNMSIERQLVAMVKEKNDVMNENKSLLMRIERIKSTVNSP